MDRQTDGRTTRWTYNQMDQHISIVFSSIVFRMFSTINYYSLLPPCYTRSLYSRSSSLTISVSGGSLCFYAIKLNNFQFKLITICPINRMIVGICFIYFFRFTFQQYLWLVFFVWKGGEKFK